MKKSRLIILSDLWGIEKAGWVKTYIENLDSKFEIQLYDCCDLGQVDTSGYLESNLHNQFVNNGIEIAVKQLLKLEKNRIDVLAFSIGGVIAWRAQLNGLKVTNFYAISSTRLRCEVVKPNCNINLYFGDKDNYKPTSDWFDKIEIKPKIFKGKEHQLYSENDCINEICNDIKSLTK